MDQIKNYEDAALMEEGLPEYESLGTFLRTARQKKGVTYEQLFEETRLRPNVLEALENEDWERLPSATFVKGFLRSYAKALQMDEEGVLMLFQERAPVEKEIPELLQRGRERSLILPLVFAVLVLCAASGLYLWKSLNTEDRPTLATSLNESSTEAPVKEAPPEETAPAAPAEEKGLKQGGAAEVAPAELGLPPTPPVQDAAAVAAPIPATEPEPEPSSDAAAAVAENQEQPPSPTGTPQETGPAVAAAGAELTLKGDVHEMTWVKIKVDGEDPKEYTFRPGSRPEWEGKKGFDLLIGNAGGIDLTFNGKKMDPLGAPGQVVRLRLPRDFEKRSVRN